MVKNADEFFILLSMITPQDVQIYKLQLYCRATTISLYYDILSITTFLVYEA